MDYTLPRALRVGGTEYDVRYDFRVILDICAALEDPDLAKEDKAYVALDIFYPEFDSIPPEDQQEALVINGGEENLGTKGPKLVSWDQDVKQIISPINGVIGREIRDIPYDKKTNTGGLHWWTFLAAYMDIGDCLFAQIVRIRDRLARGKKLDKQDMEWYRKNKHLVDIRQKLSTAEADELALWGGAKRSPST